METTFRRQTGGSGQFARVTVQYEPLPEEERELARDGLLFENRIRGGAIPQEFIRPTENGIREAMQGGVLAGYQLVDLKASLVDGSHHEVDSSEIAFKIAGSMSLKEGVQKAGPVLLEPTMRVEVVAPDDYTGAVVGDLSARRGVVQGMEPRGDGTSSIGASVPLGEMFGYATSLRNLSQGRGNFTMEFDSYAIAPPVIADNVIHGGGQAAIRS